MGAYYLSLHTQVKSNHSQETTPKEPDLYDDDIRPGPDVDDDLLDFELMSYSSG